MSHPPRALWAAALAPRLALFAFAWAHPERCLRPDSSDYLGLARALARHGEFSLSGGSPFLPNTFRVPGYPLFLLSATLGGALPDLAAVFLQCLLGAAAAVLAWFWLREAFGERSAMAGALILALDPVTALHTPLILSETLFLFLAAASAWATWRARDPKTAAYAGLLWGAASFVRPVSLYLPLGLCWLWRKAPRAAAAFLLCAYLPAAAWVTRNRAVSGRWIFSSVSGINLLRYPGAGVMALSTGRSWAELDQELVLRPSKEYRNDAERSTAFQAQALSIFADRPGLLVRYTAAGVVKLLGGTGLEMLVEWTAGEVRTSKENRPGIAGSGTAALLRAYPALIPLQLAYMPALAGLYLLSLRGFWRLWSSGKRDEAGFLLLSSAYFCLVAAINSEGYYRYRIPMMPFLAALAAASSIPPRSARKA